MSSDSFNHRCRGCSRVNGRGSIDFAPGDYAEAQRLDWRPSDLTDHVVLEFFDNAASEDHDVLVGTIKLLK